MYEATQASLKPLLAEAKGLDTDAKRFTFLLGILYGHLFYVQAIKAEVNVAANALNWMRGGRLRAVELHELYGKVAAKLLNTTPEKLATTASRRRFASSRRKSVILASASQFR